MSFFQFPIILIILLAIKCTTVKKIQSLNPSDSSLPYHISSELKAIIKRIAPDEGMLGKPIVAYLTTNIISADKGKPIRMDLPYENGDIGTDVMEILYISKKGRIFSVKKYSMSYYLNSAQIINSINVLNGNKTKREDDEEDDSDIQINCYYSISNSTFVLKKYSFESFDKYLKYSFVTIGYHNETGNLFSVTYTEDKIIIEELYKYENGSNYIKNSFIVDFFIIDQQYIDKPYLVIVTKENFMIVYEIILDNEELKIQFKFLDMISIKEFLLDESDLVLKVGKYDTMYILLTSKQGLVKIFYLENNKTKWKLGDIGNEKNYKYLDFIIGKKALYAVVENVGLVVYKMTDHFSTNQTFYHSNMKSVDYYLNPFYNNQYIGVTMTPLNNSSEVFMELLINDELHPVINKIIVASADRKLLNIFSYDSFFSILYDTKYHELFLLRRGLLSSIPFITYKIFPFKNSPINDTIFTLTSFYDKSKDIHVPALVSPNSIYIIEDLMLGVHSLNCTFNNDGNFNITLIQHGEVCANSLESSESIPYVTCQKIVSYNFHIYESDNTAVSIVFGFACGFIFLTFMSLLCLLTCNTKCFKKFDQLKLVEVDKTNRAEIYGTEEEKDKSNNVVIKKVKVNNDNTK